MIRILGIIPFLAASALIGCGKPSMRFEDLVGEWEYEECTWGGEGRMPVPCDNFRPMGTVEVRADSTVTQWLPGRQASLSGRISDIGFSGTGGSLVGNAYGDPREARVEFRIHEGALIYTLELQAQGDAGMQALVERGVLRKRPASGTIQRGSLTGRPRG
jgi:hypothetical protein